MDVRLIRVADVRIVVDDGNWSVRGAWRKNRRQEVVRLERYIVTLIYSREIVSETGTKLVFSDALIEIGVEGIVAGRFVVVQRVGAGGRKIVLGR